jgi:hypothetical protein
MLLQEFLAFSWRSKVMDAQKHRVVVDFQNFEKLDIDLNLFNKCRPDVGVHRYFDAVFVKI